MRWMLCGRDHSIRNINSNMGKKGGWLSAVKKAFTSSKDVDKDVKPHKDTKSAVKEKKRWGFGKSTQQDHALAVQEIHVDGSARSEKVASVSDKSMSLAEEEHSSHALAVAAATAAAAEAAVAAAQAAAEVIRLTGGARPHVAPYFSSLSREDRAALKIQAAFRGYLARRAFRALKGLMRLQALVRGHTVSRQATVTLRCMQSLVKVQAQVRERRNRKSEQRQHLEEGERRNRKSEQLQHMEEGFLWQESQRHDAVSKRSMSEASRHDGWEGSVHSADEAQTKTQFKEAALARRERALAYAYSHQSGAIPEPMRPAVEHGEGHVDWNWLEKWMAGRSWDTHGVRKGAPDASSCKSHEESQPDSVYTHVSSQNWQPSAPVPMSPSRPKIVKPVPYAEPPLLAQHYPRPAISAKSRLAPPPHLQHFGHTDKKESHILNARSSALAPVASRGTSRQNKSSSPIQEDDEIGQVPSYMASTKSAKAKSRSQSTPKQRSVTPDRESLPAPAKRRLSYPLTGSLNGGPVPPKSSSRQQVPQRSPVLKGISGPMHLYHSYNEVSIGSIASRNGQTRGRFR